MAIPQEKFLDLVNLLLTGTLLIFKHTHLVNFFYHINNLHQNIKFTMEEAGNGKLAFLDTLLKWNNGKISVLVYRKLTHTDKYLQHNSHQMMSLKLQNF